MKNEMFYRRQFFGIRYRDNGENVEMKVPCSICGKTVWESWTDAAVYNCANHEIDPAVARICTDCRMDVSEEPFTFVANLLPGNRAHFWRCDETHVAGVGRVLPRYNHHQGKCRYIGSWAKLFYEPPTDHLFDPDYVLQLLLTCRSASPQVYIRGPGGADNAHVLIVKDGAHRWLMLAGYAQAKRGKRR
jgi:hypothetical protein